jgi:hypothetical protein
MNILIRLLESRVGRWARDGRAMGANGRRAGRETL